MNRNQWIALIAVAVIFGGGGFAIGAKHASASSSAASRFASGAAGTFAGRTGATGAPGAFARGGAAGGGTIGTVIAAGGGTFTLQLPNSTSTAAQTGTKIVLLDNATQITELEQVSQSAIKVGQSVTVSGSANSDGSITASSVMLRPAGMNAGNVGQ